MAAKSKNRAAVVLGRAGGKKGGPARASKLTPVQRSEGARKAVQARWAKAGHAKETVSAERAFPTVDEISRKNLHLCLDRLKNAQDEGEIRHLTEELQRIVFHKQYENAEA